MTSRFSGSLDRAQVSQKEVKKSSRSFAWYTEAKSGRMVSGRPLGFEAAVKVREGARWQHTFLMQLLTIKCLAKAPTCVAAAERFQPNSLFFIGPFSVFWCRGCAFDAAER